MTNEEIDHMNGRLIALEQLVTFAFIQHGLYFMNGVRDFIAKSPAVAFSNSDERGGYDGQLQAFLSSFDAFEDDIARQVNERNSVD